MIADLDAYDYVISIGEPHQETFEKTPSVCLYDRTQHPPAMIKWGQAAVDHATLHPNDDKTLLVLEFKLKLFNLDSTTDATATDSVVSNRTAAIDYLRAIHTYTLQQFLQNNPTANATQVRYVLTIPATWVNKDSENMRQIAIEANVISASEPEAIQKARLAVLSEAHAASLFCEREYCTTSVTQLFKGQRYAVIDLGGATADLATYECTENEQGHCQLALESMDVCGSTILDQHMGSYLQDQVFFGCADERLIRLLVEQFKTKIKHYFGEDGNEHSNYIPPTAEQAATPDTTDDALLMAVVETKVPVDMMDIQQDDYDYDAFNDSYHSDDFMDDVLDDAFDDGDEDQAANQGNENSDFEGIHDADDTDGEMEEEYIYLSMPPDFKALIEPLIIENLLLRRNLTTSSQIRISHAEIAKHVFDPVVSKVISLIRKQIRKSCTTIDTLFLLGGFGQSPYLQKKLHEEFITSTNSVQRIIVPENGYRASMRGGIHYGLLCAKAIPEFYLKDKSGNLFRSRLAYSNYTTLVAIGKDREMETKAKEAYPDIYSLDFNFGEMTAVYSIIKLDDNGRLTNSELNVLIEEKLKWHKSALESSDGISYNSYDSIIYKFNFDPSKFIDEYYKSLEGVLSLHQPTLLSNNYNADVAYHQLQVRDRIYFDFYVNGFLKQLFEHIQTRRTINLSSTRYCASVSSTALLGPYSTRDTPRETLKRHLLSKMMKSTRLLNGLKCPLHDAVCDILDDYSTELLPQSRLLLPLRRKIRQVGIFLRMLEEDDNEARFSLSLHAKNSYYIRKYSLDNGNHYEASKVFVFDLSFAGFAPLYKSKLVQSYLSARSSVEQAAAKAQKRGRVQVCSIERGSLLLSNEETFFEDLDFAGILNQKSETSLTSAVEILELVTARNFSVHQLLTFIGTETDFMASEHVRDYIKQHVDLSRPDKVHRMGDVFLEPNTDSVVFMEYQKASVSMKKAIEHTIRLFKNRTFTTENVTKLLLFSWIRRILVPVVMKTHLEACKRPQAHMQHTKAITERISYFVFPEQIIETKDQGQHQRFRNSSNSRQNCAAYLFEALKQEIEPLTLSGSLPCDIEIHNKSGDDEIYGHLGCIMDAVRMPKKQETTRIARKTYAVHFLKYFVQKSNQAAAVAEDQENEDSQEIQRGNAINKQDEETDEQKMPIVEMNIDIQDHLTLYPLIRKDANLTTECHALDRNRYRLENKCSVAAVLYVSDEAPPFGEYYISNTSFKKLHRFIIPIEDPAQPIRIQCTPEDYSILFTVAQGDDWKADFRCNDLMYCC
ncbi:hypothetical protein MAM1_0303d09451 [Mucor ambiguus]|uniref:Uncharacterized protein n=1 Tax=Mucor ambiguus TaxID=91626 RepID=A0A0C9N5Q6_9FUNG|nr:hypothetical protein MAM1_0303d09451 [Mucor ambiguus]